MITFIKQKLRIETDGHNGARSHVLSEMRISGFCFSLIFSLVWLLSVATLEARQQLEWHLDVLGDPYESAEIQLPNDYEGEVVMTLIRSLAQEESSEKAVLYLHGFGDYFFQREMVSDHTNFESEWGDHFFRGDAILNVDHIRSGAEKIESPDRRIEVIEDGMHDLILSPEPVREEAYRVIFQWLEELTPEGSE